MYWRVICVSIPPDFLRFYTTCLLLYLISASSNSGHAFFNARIPSACCAHKARLRALTSFPQVLKIKSQPASARSRTLATWMYNSARVLQPATNPSVVLLAVPDKIYLTSSDWSVTVYCALYNVRITTFSFIWWETVITTLSGYEVGPDVNSPLVAVRALSEESRLKWGLMGKLGGGGGR